MTIKSFANGRSCGFCCHLVENAPHKLLGSLLQMAERSDTPHEIATFQFKSIQLFKDESLGIGSYGAVCKAKCDDLHCAAKIIHPTLLNPIALHHISPQRKHRLPIRRFEQECEFMSAIRHPNIVQYLGIFNDTETHLPVLLMELMDDSLTHFLESSTQSIPYHIQVNVCHDITQALSFLHSNNIIHRDLSSNNVLLRGDILAKVTDFGMARLSDINHQITRFTSTMCPGTDVYMPPEAVQDKPVYTNKIDCFSLGVIMLQILTRQFPNPGDRLQEVEFNHPGLPRGTVCIRIPEIDRRQSDISQIESNHSLLPIALDCLKDKENERPSAHQLCERVAILKGTPKYIASNSTLQDTVKIVQSQAVCLAEKERIISMKEEENRKLRQQLEEKDESIRQLAKRERQFDQQLRQVQQEKEKVLKENKTQLQEKDRKIARVNQQLEASEQVVVQLERQVAELELQLEQRDQRPTIASGKGKGNSKKLTSIKLRWRMGKKAPCKLNRYCDATTYGRKVYVKNEDSMMVYCYDAASDSWSQLPDCLLEGASMAILNGRLTTVGGNSHSILILRYSNELFSLSGEGNSMRWMKKFPPMPTKRSNTIALSTGTMLIVAGGLGDYGIDGVLSTVEVMNVENHQWSTAADLLEPVFVATATIRGDQLYILGGINKCRTYTKSVHTCSVSALLQSCYPSLLEEDSDGTVTSLVDATVWKKVAHLPVTHSTCQSFQDQLLAVGGLVDNGNASTAVYLYDSIANSWKIISRMKTG